ncbi:cation diffusion facilitator family transporter [Paracoccus shanxieyensis]|uniref:Cation diffusion facilitator family transporter n=1 Tax=Paracoccus shanxieyensis TaxID=2675752 RepID=A0A6L6J727_9RHOB|nr:cation diffusion facilitator family transporter [Paracoccus shanxieyensis]MTH66474.1 cation diffusion facilitator family transporter [Paracoccus shanxieyensis]MTH89701.1 cation diffusion facilitator family transporter [Paracoccus shanxieyensis]
MAHDHTQDHRPPTDLGPAFRWAVGLNTGYVIVEGAAGWITGSLALLADAEHNLTDVDGLLIAWGAAVLAKRAVTARHTWGLGRATILAALFNAIAILVGVGAVTWEAVQRLSDPVAVPGLTVMLVALVGIGVNTGSALLFMSSRKGDLNAKGAFLHMAADAAVSGAVVLAAVGIMVTGWDWLDPAVAIAVSLLIAVTAAGLFREALHMSLDGVPFEIDRAAIADWLERQDGVQGLHDLHIWPLSTMRTALAVHLVWQGADPDAFIDRVTDALAEAHGIANVTLQLERRPCDRAA